MKNVSPQKNIFCHFLKSIKKSFMSRKIAKLKFRKNGHFRSHSNKNAFAMRRFLWSIKFFKLRQISAECLHLFYVHIYCTPLLGLQIISNRFAQRELGGPVSPYTPPPPPPLPHLSIMGSMQPDTVQCKKIHRLLEP